MRNSPVLVAASSLCTAIAAQCPGVWQSTGFDGVSGSVAVMAMWDPDGAGPAAPVAVIGGKFATAGFVNANGVATWNPQSGTWAAIGGGVSYPSLPLAAEVTAAAVLPNGDLVVAGRFTHAGGVLVNHIARWNGSSWSAFGSGANGAVAALAVMPNGDLIAGGGFGSIGGVAASGVARWNGANWSPVGTGNFFPTSALAVWNGDLVAAGGFTVALGAPGDRIARWDGSAWHPLGTGLTATCTSFAVSAAGDLIAGGYFSMAGGVPAFGIARWDGANWSPLGTSLGGYCEDLVMTASGALVACGDFTTAGGVPASRVARWNGSTWSPLASGLPGTCTAVIELPNGDLSVGGAFTALSGTPADGIARWNGSTWSPLGGSNGAWNAPIVASVTLPNGDLVVGGDFTQAAGVPCSYVARKHGSTWSAVGVPPGPVASLAVTANGGILAGTSNGVVQWNGAAWVGLGPPTTGPAATALVALTSGEVFAAWKYFVPVGTGGWLGTVERWNGTTWASANSNQFFVAKAFAVDHTGSLHAVFQNLPGLAIPSFLASWSGAGWITETTVTYPTCMIVLANGDLAIGGSSGVARWNGLSLQPVPGGPSSFVLSLTTLPDGDVVAGGVFSAPGANIARWDGSAWSALGSGVVGDVSSVAADPAGGILASGLLTAAGGTGAHHVARYATTCPFIATTYLAGCPTTVGNAQWSVEVGPWVGATYRATCAGLPLLSFTVDAIGPFLNPLPLDVLLPGAGVPGCSLIPNPLVLEMRSVVNGAATSTLALPDVSWLIGIVFYHQMIPFEFDAANNLIGVTGTDTLQLTVGAF